MEHGLFLLHEELHRCFVSQCIYRYMDGLRPNVYISTWVFFIPMHITVHGWFVSQRLL